MANPTTNYGFVMPTSTDLVTDLPADFDVFGQAVDTQMLTNANAAIAKTIVDAKGDIIAATAADTVSRLAVGANNTVLTADSSTATGLKWAAPAGGSFTYIGGATFTSTSSQSLNSVFSSTYLNYLILCNIDSVSTGANINLRMRASGTDSSVSYYSNILYNDLSAGNTTFGNVSVSNGSSWKIGDLNTGGQPFGFTCSMFNPFKTVTTTFESGMHGYNYNGTIYHSMTGGYHGVGGTSYDGITIFPTSGTFTGSIRVYGYANS